MVAVTRVVWDDEEPLGEAILRGLIERGLVRRLAPGESAPGDDRWPVGYDDLLALLRSRDWPTFGAGDPSFKTFCPIDESSDSNSPSLSVGRGRRGQALLHCFNARLCGLDRSASVPELVAVLDAFETAPVPVEAGTRYARRRTGGQEVARYQYADGTYKVRVAHDDWTKDFRWPKGKRRDQLYRPPTSDDAEPTFVCEGEKDVDRLRAEGLIATCTSEGYMKRVLAEPLRDRFVAILCDYDRHGFTARDEALAVLRGIARAVVWVDIGLQYRETGGDDVSDWLDRGGSAEELLELARAAFVR